MGGRNFFLELSIRPVPRAARDRSRGRPKTRDAPGPRELRRVSAYIFSYKARAFRLPALVYLPLALLPPSFVFSARLCDYLRALSFPVTLGVLHLSTRSFSYPVSPFPRYPRHCCGVAAFSCAAFLPLFLYLLLRACLKLLTYLMTSIPSPSLSFPHITLLCCASCRRSL